MVCAVNTDAGIIPGDDIHVVDLVGFFFSPFKYVVFSSVLHRRCCVARRVSEGQGAAFTLPAARNLRPRQGFSPLTKVGVINLARVYLLPGCGRHVSISC